MEAKEILQNVNDWLRFSEAKNAAVVVLSSVFVPAIISTAKDASEVFQLYAWVSCACLLSSLFLSLLSFFPRLDFVDSIRPKEKPNDNPNLIFFGDIATLPREAYVDAIGGLEESDNGEIQKQVAAQVHNNSVITLRKLKIFNWSLKLFIAGVFTPIALLVLLTLQKNKDI